MKAVDFSGLRSTDCNHIRCQIAELSGRINASDERCNEAANDIIQRVTIEPGSLSILIKMNALYPSGQDTHTIPTHEIRVPFQTKRRGVEAKIIIGGGTGSLPQPDHKLINTIQQAFAWQRRLVEEPDCTIDQLALQSTTDPTRVTRYLPLAFLAPDIIEAVLLGKQPVDLNVQRLKKISPIPSDWQAQRELLGFTNTH